MASALWTFAWLLVWSPYVTVTGELCLETPCPLAFSSWDMSPSSACSPTFPIVQILSPTLPFPCPLALRNQGAMICLMQPESSIFLKPGIYSLTLLGRRLILAPTIEFQQNFFTTVPKALALDAASNSINRGEFKSAIELLEHCGQNCEVTGIHLTSFVPLKKSFLINLWP